jgi:hypothetical protein
MVFTTVPPSNQSTNPSTGDMTTVQMNNFTVSSPGVDCSFPQTLQCMSSIVSLWNSSVDNITQLCQSVFTELNILIEFFVRAHIFTADILTFRNFTNVCCVVHDFFGFIFVVLLSWNKILFFVLVTIMYWWHLFEIQSTRSSCCGISI